MPRRFTRRVRLPKKSRKSKARRAGTRKVRVKRTTRARKARGSTMIHGNAGGVTSSYVSIKQMSPRVTPSLSSYGAPCRSLVQTPGQIVGTAGTQVTALVGQWFSVQDIQNISNTSVPSLPGYLGQPLPTHFTMKSINAEVTLVNPTSLPMIYDLYDIVARRDIPNSSTLPSPALDVTNPIGAWHTGLLAQSMTPVGATAYENEIGCRPVDSQLFNDYFKVVKHTSVVLPQASTHIHKVFIQSNKVFDKNELQLLNLYLNGLAGVTQYTIVVCRGSVGIDTTGGGILSTTLEPALRWVTVERYTFSHLQTGGSSWMFKDYLSQPAVGNVASINLNNPSIGVPTMF